MDFSLLEDICRCCCRALEQNSKVMCTPEHVKQMQELIGDPNIPSVLSKDAFICSKCHNKLNEFISFKFEIVNAQQKYMEKLQLDVETDVIIPKVEIKQEMDDNEHDAFMNEENILSFETDDNDFTLPVIPEMKHSIKAGPSKTFKKYYSESSNRSKRKRKDTPLESDHFCPVCSKFFTEARKVRAHVERVHLKKKNHQCDMCEYTAYKKYDIFLHITNIHRPKEQLQKNSICPTCGVGFLTNSKLNIHIRRKHLRELVKKITCDNCGHKTFTLNEMRNHMKVHLSRELREIYKCLYCDASFWSKGSLKNHTDVKHKHDNPSIQCFCGKTFRQKSVYQRHHAVIHLGEKKHRCADCGKCFSEKLHLEYHRKALHTETSAIPCHICGTLYKSPETLKKHMIYHEPPKFSCLLCGKKFHENKKLLDHESAHRTLAYACNHCSRSFRLESQLTYHLKKVHFKEKLTYRCEMCSSTFTRKSTYRDHAIRQHKELDQQVMGEFLQRIKKCVAEEKSGVLSM